MVNVCVLELNKVFDEQTITSIAEPLSRFTLSSSENVSKSLNIRANKTKRWIGTIRKFADGLGGFSDVADDVGGVGGAVPDDNNFKYCVNWAGNCNG